MAFHSSHIISREYAPLLADMERNALRPWLGTLPAQIQQAFSAEHHGDWPNWKRVLEQLPTWPALEVCLEASQLGVNGYSGDLITLKALLMGLHPWRKGPYHIHGLQIDTEWRSDWKWERLAPHIRSLENKWVLDVGCGNGFHLWCMLGSGARLALGVDPTLLSVTQFLAIKHYMGDKPAYVLPVGVEDIPLGLRAFDTVFSMGVLYHRRSPLDHLLELKGSLKPGGELVLETLVVEGGLGYTLLPPDRYARMRNIWFIPSCSTLENWLSRCGYKHIRCVDVTPTRTTEQRTTEWMRFESLEASLNPDHPELTVECLPAPVRAIFVAESS
ncbi:MAG: tRNA 5-methoxyuridine(34)/uridine 5-oxyacetic acid(34) synthase CmoB [Methylococcaceae bacterium]